MTEQKNEKTKIQLELEKLQKEKAKYEQKIQELESKGTFKGLYSWLRGRGNWLSELNNNDQMTDEEKFNDAIEVLSDYIKEVTE